MKRVNLLGKTFGSLIVICKGKNKTISKKAWSTQWICKCMCGKEVLITSGRLLQPRSANISCGCKNFTGNHKGRKYKDCKMVSYNAKIKSYKFSAKNCATKKINWKLTYEEAIALFNGNCHYCNSEPYNTYNVYITKSGKMKSRNEAWCSLAEIKYNGIDRKDSTMDYVSGNVVSCCKICNYAKNELSLDDFYKWIGKIALNQGYIKK